MTKAQFLHHWSKVTPNQAVKPAVVPYKHEGTTFDQDGIRITGSREFIDSVLSKLKELLQYENSSTRLQASYQQSTCKETGLKLDAFKCYIQVHRRGRVAIAMNQRFGF